MVGPLRLMVRPLPSYGYTNVRIYPQPLSLLPSEFKMYISVEITFHDLDNQSNLDHFTYVDISKLDE